MANPSILFEPGTMLAVKKFDGTYEDLTDFIVTEYSYMQDMAGGVNLQITCEPVGQVATKLFVDPVEQIKKQLGG